MSLTSGGPMERADRTNDAPLFSFIIPVYNVENYLPSCLDSVLAQTLQRFEVILINDGSTDGSLAICEEYCRLHDNFRLCDKQNEGQGIARNVGLSMARGTYIVFIDSDDTIDELLCEHASEWMAPAGVDFTNFGLSFVNEVGNEVKQFGKFRQEEMTGPTIFRHAMLDDQIFSSPVNKVYRRSFLDAHNIRFPEVRSAEDTHFSRALAMYAQRTRFVSRVYYRALIRSNSMTRGLRRDYLGETIAMLESEIGYFRVRSADPDLEALYGAHFCKLTSFLLVQTAFRAKDDAEFREQCRKAQASSYGKFSRDPACLRFLRLKARLMVALANRPTLLRWCARFASKAGIKLY
ncbi:glycosyltransferase [Pandoraea communis]|uniref:glycosyltransferase n=1 Tax=Pandoraea communis TaxID=2508297 RepID=UPI0025A5754E|nr:glycosyltransferase [Pandoraea communis]MDM8355013.1 glycosyltransferase [Pandoraea communis]